MADKIVTDFLKNIKAKSGEAIKWFKKIVKQTQRATFPAATGRKEFTGERSTGVRGTPLVGKLYLFQYDAKLKDEMRKARKGPKKGQLVPVLPYWDMWPLIFPFDFAKNGFYGINLHYLEPNARADLMIRLIKAQGGSGNMSENYKLKLSYNIITKFKPAIPCIKRYLFSQVQGRGFHGISGEDWSYAAALPLYKFQKKPASYVWKQSALMY